MRTRLRTCALLTVSIACVHCSGTSGGALSGKPTGSSSGSGGGARAATGGASGGSGSGSTSGGGGTSEPSGSSGGSGETAGSSSGTGPSDASPGEGGPGGGDCGMRTGMRGKTTRTLMVGSTSRSYIAYLPASASPTKALPFVYVFHGASQDGSYLYDMTQYSMLADSEGIAVVFPDGQGVNSATTTTSLTPWSVSDDGAAVCGAGSLVSNANPVDFAFMDAIKADVTQDQCLDSAHTFATGFSMGGYFTHHIACDRTDIRAAAPHSGGTLASLGSCKTNHVPIIIFHGTSDPLIAPGCDDPNSSAQAGFPASATLWAQKNGCKSTYTTTPENGAGGGDGQCYLYDGCPADGQVELCTFTNMSHAWAGAPVCTACIGSGSTYASATQLQWSFFKKYAW
jgi:polyhydroxybutyrate depolymerase